MRKVALIGRTNVGKSTLFNRLSGTRNAIVFDQHGVTRDIRESQLGNCIIVDTPGMFDDTADFEISQAMSNVLDKVLATADIFLLIVDCVAGLSALDEKIAAVIRKTGKECILVCNKSEKKESSYIDFFELGIDRYVCISAEHGLGIDDLFSMLNINANQPEERNATKIAIIGKPNVGKSTIVNSILGENKRIVADVPGATRESSLDYFEFDKQLLAIIDTPGVRKRAKIDDRLEKISVANTIKSCQIADIVFVVIDALNLFNEHLDKQDLTLINIALKYGKTIIIVINKMDLTEYNSTPKFVREQLQYRLSQFKNIPLFSICGHDKSAIMALLKYAVKLHQKQDIKISTSDLNKWLAFVNGNGVLRNVKLKYITQIGTTPLKFLIFVSNTENLISSQKRYIENSLRQTFRISEIPMQIIFRQNK